MKFKFVTAITLLTLTAAAFADSQFERTLTVSAQPDLSVNTGSGEIHLHPGADGSIHIIGHVHAGGWSVFGAGDVNDRIRQIVAHPPIVQDGNTVHVGQTTDHDLFNNIAIDYDITAPASVALNLHSGSGGIQVDHIGGYLSASTGSGDIRADSVHGAAELRTGSGNIELDGHGAGDVKAQSGSGSIRIQSFSGVLTARTGSGSIDVAGHLAGPAMISSGSGSVHLHLGSNARFNLEASTGSGDIQIRFPGAPEQGEHLRHHMTAAIDGGGPPLEIRTGSGDIVVDPQ